MISIVVSSYKPDLFLQFQKNVADTIGVDYEIIKVDNPGLMGLCAAYNIGISRAKYDYICFSHEDLIFHTCDWGKNLIQTFDSDNSIGLIGVAGSSYKSFLPSGWAPPQLTRFPKINILQRINGIACPLKDLLDHSISPNVVTLDGCWFATKKSVVETCKFDEDTFKGYHCYDIDFCLNVGLQYKIKVVYDILLEHLSLGSYDKNWMEDTIKLHRKWNNLPRQSEAMTSKEILNQESLSCIEWLKRVKKNNSYGSLFFMFSLLPTNKFRKVLGFKNWLIFPFYILCVLIRPTK